MTHADALIPIACSRILCGHCSSAPPHIPHEGLNLGLVVSGPEQVRRTVRILIKYGVDTIKLTLSGEEITGTKAEETPMADEKVAMAVGEARRRNESLAAYERELENAVETMKEMHRRGIRVLIGGDYGFAWTPMGTNAKDLDYFVDLLGMSSMEAIQAGTHYGGEIMGMGNELGLVREGYLADLLLVDGRPEHGRARPPGPELPARDHEGWEVSQGARERSGVHAAHRLSGPPGRAFPPRRTPPPASGSALHRRKLRNDEP